MFHPPRPRLLLALAFVAATGCGPAEPPARPQAPPEKPAAAPATTPADISHGEAPIGAAPSPAPRDADAPARTSARLRTIRLEISHAPLTLDSGVTYDGWTFGGTAPGPALRATVGDTVDFTLVNKALIPHSMDFHAAEVAPSRVYTNIMPNDSIHYRFVPRVPGAFMYHCGTAPVAAHIANGMYGALVVDPVTPRPAAREFVLVQSEWYYTGDGPANRTLDWNKLLEQSSAFVVFNGQAAQYARHPIGVKVGEPLRIYLVNAGPNRMSSFHVVGGIFDRVFADGGTTPTFSGIQTAAVPVGGGAIFELRLKEPGTYPFVTHAFADATKGAVGVFKAE